MNQEDETRRKLFDIVYRTETKDFGGYSTRDAEAIVESLLAAGVQIPRVMETIEELEAMPAGSAIRDGEACICERDGDGWLITGSRNGYIHRDILLPATVLYVPAEAK